MHFDNHQCEHTILQVNGITRDASTRIRTRADNAMRNRDASGQALVKPHWITCWVGAAAGFGVARICSNTDLFAVAS
jgi:hypothetical protein